MARAFGAPVILDSPLREGSFRKALSDRRIPSIVYETGEALRLDEAGIRLGVNGVLGVMRELGMLPARDDVISRKPYLAMGSKWLRAPMSGMFRSNCRLGDTVVKNQVLGSISDPLGEDEIDVHAGWEGVVIGRLNQALVYQGDALLHVARFKVPGHVTNRVRRYSVLVERESESG